MVMAAAVSGCPSAPRPDGGGTKPPTEGDGAGAAPAQSAAGGQREAWAPRPEAVRIYPSTRFVMKRHEVTDELVPILEARIELFDAMGDSIKASGTARFALHAMVGRDSTQEGRLLYEWEQTLSTLKDHQLHYDPITRGYVFDLGIDDVELVRRPTLLKVVFQPIDGARLRTEAQVETRW